MPKITLKELSENSTPCGICVAMNGKEYVRPKDCTKKVYTIDNNLVGGSGCMDADKAMIKLLYLNYMKKG